MKSVKIGKRYVGDGHPCFIVAEAGCEFNSDLHKAKAAIKKAKEAGADAVKFQTFRAENLVTPQGRFVFDGGKKVSQFDFFKKRELSREAHRILKKYADDAGIIFFSTPSHKDDVDLLEEIGVAVYKTGSDDLTNTPLLGYIIKKKKPLLVATGMSTECEIREAVSFFRKNYFEDFVLLHCIVGYPVALDDANLNCIKRLGELFGCLVGLSDHTLGDTAPIVATALGGCVLEKHFSPKKSRGSPDRDVACDFKELKNIIRGVRQVEAALGSRVRRVFPVEESWRYAARKSIVAFRDIPRGIRITEDMVCLKRPSYGMPPSDLARVIGKFSKREIKADTMIRPGMFTNKGHVRP